MRVNVLITGMGQTVGIGIYKALKMSSLDCRIAGSDREPRSAGLYMVDEPLVLPDSLTQPKEYLKQMAAYCRRRHIDILLLGSEAEVRFFAPLAQEFIQETGTFVMVSPASVINWASDKWETYKFLSRQEIPVPATVIPGEADLDSFIEQYGFPLIAKPRLGTASRGFQIIENSAQLRCILGSTTGGMVIQEYLWPDKEEYTVGAFLSAPGQCCGVITMRRELSAGITFRAEVVMDDEIDEFSREVAERSGLIGPCNIQLRKTSRGPVILEINPRFSSSVPIRAYFGFNEPAMAVEQFVLKKPPAPPRIRYGLALRYWEEKYIDKPGV